jgi:hypothetical protein
VDPTFFAVAFDVPIAVRSWLFVVSAAPTNRNLATNGYRLQSPILERCAVLTGVLSLS